MDGVIENFDLVLKAFWLTLQLFVVSAVFSLVFGTLLAAFRVGPIPVLATFGSLYVSIIRNTPLLVIFIFIFIAFPTIELNIKSFLVKGSLALSIYTSAFVCEAIRSGINAVPVGQAEASRSIGLTFTQSMRLVVLPQALRAVVPPLTSVQIALVKNTSVAAAFGLIEATFRLKFFLNRSATDKIFIFITFAIGYIIIVELLSAYSATMERRWRAAR